MGKSNIGMGDASCGSCGQHAENIPVVLDSKESDGEGGFWFNVGKGTFCSKCGEPFNVYHLPKKESETMSNPQPSDQDALDLADMLEVAGDVGK